MNLIAKIGAVRQVVKKNGNVQSFWGRSSCFADLHILIRLERYQSALLIVLLFL